MPTPNDSISLSSQYVDLPAPGIHVLVSITETVCQPKIVKYHVTISDAPGAHHVSYIFKDDESVPAYIQQFDFTSVPADIERFKGSFERWTQLSDAFMIYQDFTGNLTRSGTAFASTEFECPSMSNETKPYVTPDWTTVETCLLGGKTWVQNRMVGKESLQEIWPLSVFGQRLHE
jgi:hypothetical protein